MKDCIHGSYLNLNHIFSKSKVAMLILFDLPFLSSIMFHISWKEGTIMVLYFVLGLSIYMVLHLNDHSNE